MSVLEIILYSLLGVGFITWLVISIYQYKHPEKFKKKKKTEQKDDEE